ncbi:MAG TPA: shikimate dehydrogenase [Rhodospirillaceae bacterium]|nr:shikimate dehydrogenase [Rhodospirillaceae bacterium]
MIPALTGEARLAGVMGWPVKHSKSPRLHGFWLHQHGIDGAYLPLAVDPAKLNAALRALPVLGFRGVNLTIPHKELAMGILDHIDPLARRVGAANTVIVQSDGSLLGKNTDVYGFAQNILAGGFAPTASGFTATVLGAGGAARAVIVALQDMGAVDIRLVNRDQERAKKLCADLSGDNVFSVFSWDQSARALEGADLLINATSLGMAGQPALSLDLAPLPAGAMVTDIVYVPLETELLKTAKARGLKTVDGLGMLLHQAVPGFAAWFGQMPEVTPALRAHLLEVP